MDKEQAEKDRLQYEFEALEKRIENDFTYHAPRPAIPGDAEHLSIPADADKYQALRSVAKDLAHLINRLCPGGREKSTALTKLEETIMWTNAGISRGPQI